jgi:hypothetical protein
MTAIKETIRIDLPDSIHPYPTKEFPREPQIGDTQINMQQITESRRRQIQILDEQGFGLPKKMRGIVDSFVNIASKNETSLFHNGDEKISFADKEPAQNLYHQLRGIIATKCEDYFDEDGIIKKDERDEQGKIQMNKKTETGWNNIAGIAPKIAEILLAKDHNIKSVNRDQFLNIFSYAIDVAQDPSLLEKTTISVGFGGSADTFSSSRLPAYGLPAQLIAENINAFYQDRLTTSIDKARVKKYQDDQIAKQKEMYGDTSPLIQDHIMRVSQGFLRAEKQSEATSGTSVQLLPLLNSDELAEVKRLYAIPEKPLKLRFFSGAEAGIESNFPDKATNVRERREGNWDVIRTFTTEYFPELAGQMTFENDIPWGDHSVEQQTVLEYCAHLLRTSPKESIQSTLSFLEGLGLAKGGEQGKELAAEYAGLHVFFFKDKINLPAAYTNFFETSHVFEKPEVGIMIGGRSEEMFSGVRDYIAEHSTPEGLRDFALLKATRLELEAFQSAQEGASTSTRNGSQPEHSLPEIYTLRHMAKRMDQWNKAITKRRETYDTPDERLAPSDRPRTNISLISGTEMAPYYLIPGDMEYGTDPKQQIEMLDADRDENKEDEIYKKAVRRELSFLMNATNNAA